CELLLSVKDQLLMAGFNHVHVFSDPLLLNRTCPNSKRKRELVHRSALSPIGPCSCPPHPALAFDFGSLGNHGTLTIFFGPLQRTKSAPLAKPRCHSPTR